MGLLLGKSCKSFDRIICRHTIVPGFIVSSFHVVFFFFFFVFFYVLLLFFFLRNKLVMESSVISTSFADNETRRVMT